MGDDPGRVGGHPAEMNSPGGDLDDERDVEPAQEYGVYAREVGRDDPSGLGAEELDPRRSGAVTGGVDW